MLWQTKLFSELEIDMLFNLMKARVDVFVVEQQCAYPELDEIDKHEQTRHVFLSQQYDVQAYARVYRKSMSECAIGRVLIVETERGKGLAKPLMKQALDVCNTHFAQDEIVISAQTYLLPFYESLGFKLEGVEYLEDGIPHHDMRYKKALE
ncbi:Protein ElaA [Pseudoalteromonas holothuriae]|uniref:Protein ElaA n=1 Tax=Pseudoalteromonas holothuriae TaxID=2963714 RepID=A0A9W4W3Q2_9GAMM|nr:MULTISPECIES: GNAT family N-acetyltransferase [unclassified Pseudoalteromonas]CAH9054521.1 Protein ElaA [Pseudoalteromonas sp. CIP111951]CAH9057206.1 Protein ElaA [Pseudoalteromonas sp. CIP111854]